MALTWDVNGIKDHDTVCWYKEDDGKEYQTAITRRMIFATMTTGIGEITAKNCAEFFARVRFVDKYYGWSEDITPADVEAHIGLKTNVGPFETRSEWMKRYPGYLLDLLKGQYDREVHKPLAEQTG